MAGSGQPIIRLGPSFHIFSQIGHAAIDAVSFGRGETGTVRIGIFSSLASGFLSDLLRAYVAANPTVRADLIEGCPSAHMAAIQRHHLDVAFLTGDRLGRSLALPPA
jgi:DNA-binding transcriptional LysR family regulator